MKIGIFKTSLKENECRVPIYPEHLPRFQKSLRLQMLFESNYGFDYGFPDEYFISHGATIAERNRMFSECDLVVLPKPVPDDLASMRPNQVLFCWELGFYKRGSIQYQRSNILW